MTRTWATSEAGHTRWSIRGRPFVEPQAAHGCWSVDVLLLASPIEALPHFPRYRQFLRSGRRPVVTEAADCSQEPVLSRWPPFLSACLLNSRSNVAAFSGSHQAVETELRMVDIQDVHAREPRGERVVTHCVGAHHCAGAGATVLHAH